MKKLTVTSTIVLVVILVHSAALAGSAYSVECENDKCDFESKVKFGGGMFFQMRTGYCAECEQFVYVSWTREGEEVKDPKPKPEPVGNVWNPSTGETQKLFPCPHCNKPFLPIKLAEELKHCPECGKATVTKEYKYHYD